MAAPDRPVKMSAHACITAQKRHTEHIMVRPNSPTPVGTILPAMAAFIRIIDLGVVELACLTIARDADKSD